MFQVAWKRCSDTSKSVGWVYSVTYTGIAEVHADMFHIIWPETHHKIPHIGTDFVPLDLDFLV
jgi:hypothetical protein